MGTVWEAHDEWLDRWVAIKRVTAPSSLPRSELDQIRTRAFREARAIASVADPHVVTVHDLLEDADGPAIVMELLESVSIAEVLSNGGPLTESQTVCIGIAVTSALMAAHGAGVTHRDVKPGNVLLCRDGRVKLTDFGIARSAAEQTLTATGLLLGSPAYIAPEVASGKPATPSADIWGLGALLFACLEGRPPYDAGDPLRTLTAVVQDPVPPFPHAGRLTALLGSLLQKDPRRRMALGHAHRLLSSLNTDPTGGSMVVRVWGSPAIPGHTSRRRPTDRPGQRPPPQQRPAAQYASGPQPRPPNPPAPRPAPQPPPIPRRDQTSAPARPAPAREELPPPPWATGAVGSTSAAELAPLPTRLEPRIVPRSRRTKALAVTLAVVLGLAGFLGARWFGATLAAPPGVEQSSGAAQISLTS